MMMMMMMMMMMTMMMSSLDLDLDLKLRCDSLLLNSDDHLEDPSSFIRPNLFTQSKNDLSWSRGSISVARNWNCHVLGSLGLFEI